MAKSNPQKEERQNWREFKQGIKKKKTELLVQRLDRQIERKQKEQQEQEEKEKREQKELRKLKKQQQKDAEQKLIDESLNDKEREENLGEEDGRELDEETLQQSEESLQEEEEEEEDDRQQKLKQKKEKKKKRKQMEEKQSEEEPLNEEGEEEEATIMEAEEVTTEQENEEPELKEPKKKKKKKIINESNVVASKEEQDKKFVGKTVSIAVPASIILNAQTPELQAYLIGQIARTAAIFNCYEIVVYDEYCTNANFEDEETEEPKVECVRQMSRVLQYLECPQYLRKSLFPLHKDFRFAGVINPLDSKHHLRFEDESEFREGVVNANKNGKSFVYIGLKKEALVDQEVEPGTRVTVQLDIFEEKNYYNGKIVSPNLPKERLGTYWGYEVRVAKSLHSVLNESPFGGKYDLTIGTSDRGENVDEAIDQIPDFEHALVIFGGLKGIESALEADENFKEEKDAKNIFDFYLNTCPKQGTNTIRTEEALLISLANLRSKLFS